MCYRRLLRVEAKFYMWEENHAYFECSSFKARLVFRYHILKYLNVFSVRINVHNWMQQNGNEPFWSGCEDLNHRYCLNSQTLEWKMYRSSLSGRKLLSFQIIQTWKIYSTFRRKMQHIIYQFWAIFKFGTSRIILELWNI